MSETLPQSWLAAAADPAIAAELEAIYAEAARATAERKPVCVSSSRCCHFDAYGHRLYVTGLEAAYTLARVPPLAASSPRSSAESRAPALRTAAPRTASSGTLSLPVLSPRSLASAPASPSCPFLRGTLCSVHEIKPLACRTFYCDPTAQDWQHELTERLLARLRALHERHGIEYRYGEWRGMLAMFSEAAAPG